MHGYELRKRLNAALGAFRALSYGSLYPCLQDAARPGWIAEAATTRRTGTAAPAAAGRGSSTSSPPTGKEHFQAAGRRVRARPPGRTTTSTCTSPSSPAPRPRSGCASSRAAAAGSRSGSTSIRADRGQEPRAARRLHRRAAAARPRVGRARGALAERADQHRARRQPGQQLAPSQASTTQSSTTQSSNTYPTTAHPGMKETPWVPYASPSSASATAPARWSRASSTTRTPTRRAPSPG